VAVACVWHRSHRISRCLPTSGTGWRKSLVHDFREWQSWHRPRFGCGEEWQYVQAFGCVFPSWQEKQAFIDFGGTYGMPATGSCTTRA